MIGQLLAYFRHVKSESLDAVKSFQDAYEWILTYRKAGDYTTAIRAARELLLKVKSGITYYSEAEKKVAALAASNIESVAKPAKEKKKVIAKTLASLYSWETKIHKLVLACEEEAGEQKEKEEKEKIEAGITADIKAINDLVTKKDITGALFAAKKLASAHFQSKRATETLLKIQKLYDRYEKQQSSGISQKKIDSFMKEVWIQAPVEKKKEEETPKKQGFFERFRAVQEDMKKRQEDRRKYLSAQSNLQKIEKMLIESGSITKISSSDKEEDVLSIMESGLTKDISDFRLDGYNFFGKIIGKDKIVGDTFGSFKNGSKTLYYFWDATGHGIQAGFTVSMLTKIFFEQTKKGGGFVELYQKINNELKQKLKGKVFVTAVLFEHDTSTSTLQFLGAGHDPIFFYHHTTKTVEKIIPGNLALWVRLISNTSSLKPRVLPMEEHDVLVGYTDGIIEARNPSGEFYGIERMMKAVEKYAPQCTGNIAALYAKLYADVCSFQGKDSFLDDVSLFLFERDPKKDLVTNKKELDALLKELDNSAKTVKMDFKGKTREEILAEMEKVRHEAELKARMTVLERLYKLGEYWKLKQEITICYKQWFIHKRMEFFLKKIIQNEEKSKSLKQEERLQKKYEVLLDLYEKGEYSVVIRETVDVLYKNGNI